MKVANRKIYRVDEIPAKEKDKLVTNYYDILNTQGEQKAEEYFNNLSTNKKQKIEMTIRSLALLKQMLL